MFKNKMEIKKIQSPTIYVATDMKSIRFANMTNVNFDKDNDPNHPSLGWPYEARRHPKNKFIWW